MQQSSATNLSLAYSYREGAAIVVVNNNPSARNPISLEFYLVLQAALNEAEQDSSVGAVVLTGAEGFFCAGGDLELLATARQRSADERRERLDKLHDTVIAIRQCTVPVIAAVEGGAAGAGASLAFACDLLICAEDAYFSIAYVKVGLTPDGGATAFLQEMLPRQLMAEMCLLGNRIDVQRLHNAGAINQICVAGETLLHACKTAEKLARGPQHAIANIKHLCLEAQHNSLSQQLDLEAELMIEAQVHDEAQEGISAFFEKRHANFRAKE